MSSAISLLVLVSISISFSFSQISCSETVQVLMQGSSLSVEEQVVLLSNNGEFSAGFYAVGDNAYSFAVWFTQPSAQNPNPPPTVVWMANRDQPVNGKRSTLSLLKSGNLVLDDAGEFTVWATDTSSPSPVELILADTGNLILRKTGSEKGGTVTLWQSFDFPTNTLLPQQQLTRHTILISSRSDTNHSSGFYKFYFDNDNVIRLLYDGPEISSIYWPAPYLLSWQVGRSTYNGSRVAVLDSFGKFNSSDGLGFVTSDYGTVLQRRLTLDYDGNVRVYSRKNGTEDWYVSWQAISEACSVHGICGANSTCSYNHGGSRTCSCLPGYKRKNGSDWSVGCEPMYNSPCSNNGSVFVRLPQFDFYGYDFDYFPNSTFEACFNACLQSCVCKGFQYKFADSDGHFYCYPKSSLLNGYSTPDFPGEFFLKLPPGFSHFDLPKYSVQRLNTSCSSSEKVLLERAYMKNHQNSKVKLLLWFVPGLGVFEAICIFLVWCFLLRTRPNSDAYAQGYLPAAGTGFRKYHYSEMKKATRNFSEEIGRGAAGIVYKGELSDHPVVAIKRLKEANQGEDEFLDEVSIIGNLNHMNLIKILGYCAEGKHRMLVYEYMEKGSLAENLGPNNNALDFSTRFNIALGVARGLAYLHEECLEWILHCDVKPQNILLDSNYEPKVADFGLSKLLNRNDGSEHSNLFSTIRGTRGYMAPEWVFNLPITSKVDVYSYGIVVLEMVTGKSPTIGAQQVDGFSEERQHWRLVTWVRDKKANGSSKLSWLKQIVDPVIGAKFEPDRLEILVDVALQCVEEDRDARPTMRHVVEILRRNEKD